MMHSILCVGTLYAAGRPPVALILEGSDNIMMLIFEEEIDPTSGVVITNYSMEERNVVAVRMFGESNRFVILKFNEGLIQDGFTPILNIEGVRSASGEVFSYFGLESVYLTFIATENVDEEDEEEVLLDSDTGESTEENILPTDEAENVASTEVEEPDDFFGENEYMFNLIFGDEINELVNEPSAESVNVAGNTVSGASVTSSQVEAPVDTSENPTPSTEEEDIVINLSSIDSIDLDTSENIEGGVNGGSSGASLTRGDTGSNVSTGGGVSSGQSGSSNGGSSEEGEFSRVTFDFHSIEEFKEILTDDELTMCIDEVYFEDIAGHYAEEAIKNFFCRGYVNGYTPGIFAPDRLINRAAVAKLVFDIFYSDDVSITEYANEPSFADVEVSEWYAPYVAATRDYGIFEGYADDTFRPANNITRAEFVIVLLRANGFFVVETKFKNIFNDVVEEDWYANMVLLANSLRIVQGYDNGYFGPHDNLTIGQGLLMLQRASMLIKW